MSAFSDKLRQIFVNIHNRFVEVDNKIEDIKNSSANGISTELKTRYDTATLQAMYNEVIEPSPEKWFTFDSESQAITGLNEEYAEEYSSVTKLVFPYMIGGKSVKKIGEFAFLPEIDDTWSTSIPNMVNDIRLPNCIDSIGNSAFSKAPIKSINIPTSCYMIGSYAFEFCQSLEEVITPIKPNWELVIGGHAFFQCFSLINIDTIIDGVKEISEGAFGYTNVENAIIPESVDVINRNAFDYSSLRYITILNKNCNISDNMIENSSLELIKGYKGSTAETYAKNNGIPFMSIEGTEVLDKADKADIYTKMDLLSYYGDKDVTPTDSSLFEFDESTGTITNYSGDDTDVVIPYEINGVKVEYIGVEAFEDCSSFTSVDIPNSVTSIGSYAFSYCKSLTSIDIPDSVTNIDDYAFYECDSLTNISIGNSVASIGDWVFTYSANLEEVTIGNSVTSIGKNVFSGCNNLTVVCNSGSYAETYCQENNINYVLDTVSPDSLGGGSITIDQTYDAESENAQSGVAVAEAFVVYEEAVAEYTDTMWDTAASPLDEYFMDFQITSAMGHLHSAFISVHNHLVSLKRGKTDNVVIESNTDTSYTFEFSNTHNTEKRLADVETISFVFGNGEYSEDYTSGLSFDSGETPTAIDYTDSGILNWVGTDCVMDSYVNDEGVTVPISKFQPSPNTHYDIVFYFNGTQFIGLVNGFVPTTQIPTKQTEGNVVSE